jgi:hypothetical protein
VPEKGIMVAQVVDCAMMRNYSFFNPISIGDGQEIRFPPGIENCSEISNADLELDLNELSPRTDFKKISMPISTFE